MSAPRRVPARRTRAEQAQTTNDKTTALPATVAILPDEKVVLVVLAGSATMVTAIALREQTILLFAALGTAIALLATARRLTILTVIAATAPIMSVVPVGGVNLNLALSDIFGPLLLYFALRIDRSHAYGGVLQAYAYGLMATIVLSAGVNAWTGSNFSLTAATMSIIKTTVVLVYLLGTFVLLNRGGASSVQAFLEAWIWVAFLISLTVMFSEITGYTLLGSLGSVRSTGTFDDPNLFAVYIAVSVGIAVWRYGPSRPAPLVILLPTFLSAIVATGSRGGAIAVTAAAAVVLIMYGWRSRVVLLAGLIGAALFKDTVLHAASQYQQIARILSSAEGLDDARSEIWLLAYRLWLENPVMGVGPGNFIAKSVGLFADGRGRVAHNTYLSFAVESGVLGLLVFSSLWLWMLWRTYTCDIGRMERAGMIFSILSLMGGMFSLDLQNSRYGWLLAAVVITTLGFQSRKGASGRPAAREVGNGTSR